MVIQIIISTARINNYDFHKHYELVSSAPYSFLWHFASSAIPTSLMKMFLILDALYTTDYKLTWLLFFAKCWSIWIMIFKCIHYIPIPNNEWLLTWGLWLSFKILLLYLVKTYKSIWKIIGTYSGLHRNFKGCFGVPIGNGDLSIFIISALERWQTSYKKQLLVNPCWVRWVDIIQFVYLGVLAL